ncbi:MAG: hypothetical protein ACI9YH_000989 [Colwellia sp.]|jgi:hypothetical protein
MTLENTKSGKAGEYSVLAKLSRFGIKVSKPQWDDDEVDYEIHWGVGDKSVNIPLQVKSVQFSPKKDKSFIQGLKKKYLQRNSLLCLAIYNPDYDWMWIFCGSDTIEDVYAQQLKWNKRHHSYSVLDNNDDVRIAVPKDGLSFHQEHRIYLEDKTRVLMLIEGIALRKKISILSPKHDLKPSATTLCSVRFMFKNIGVVNIGGESLFYRAEGTVNNLITLVYDTLKQHVAHRSTKDSYNIVPMNVFRELIVNAFAHRSYSSEEPIDIIISEKKIEITNPGGLPEGLNMKEFNEKCFVVVRNPVLVRDLVRLGVMENMGSGIYKIESVLTEHKSSQIEFSESEGSFIAAINRTKASAN